MTDKAFFSRLLHIENNMIVRMGYCAGEAGHDLSGEEVLGASLPMRCKYGVLSHKAVHQEQDTGKTAIFLEITRRRIMSISEQRQSCKDMTEEVLACRDILYTVPETAHLLRVNKNTVYDLINCGYLRSIKLGSRKISRKAILEFVEQFDGKTVELPGIKSE